MGRDPQLQAGLKAGFDFARQVRDPDFRAFLDTVGSARTWIVPATAETTIGDILHRVEVNGTESPFLIAVVDEGQRFGFRFLIGDVRS